MKWIQCNDLGLTHVFELEGDRTTTIHLVGDIDTVKRKLKLIFGPDVKIVTFKDDE